MTATVVTTSAALSKQAICVVSCQLGANGCRAVVWIQGSLLIPRAACLRAFPETVRSTSLAPIYARGCWFQPTWIAPKWCIKSDNGHCQVCRCSMLAAEFSGFELDDKALLDILCDVFSQKCSAAWQGAPGQRLTVAIMLPGRQDADDWLNFMLSQKNLGPPLQPGGLSQRRFPEKTFRKERRRLQAKHMDGGQAELARVG